jgi:Stigma-specific protein, Stig1
MAIGCSRVILDDTEAEMNIRFDRPVESEAGELTRSEAWRPTAHRFVGPASDVAAPFDEFAKDLARGISRREALRRLGGSLAGALLASIGLGGLSLRPAEADDCLTQCDQGYNQCTAGCDASAEAGLRNIAAQLRACIAGCPAAGREACTRRCLATSAQQAASLQAARTACLSGCDSQRSACRDACSGCPAGQTRCGTTCVDTSQDDNNCGVCGMVCSGGTSCVSSECRCPTPQSLCSGICVDTATDPSNCGICEKVCADGESCCQGMCVDVQGNDAANCGSCGNVCPAEFPVCIAGTCVGES